MKELLIVLMLISFVVNKECQPNEALDEQTQKCEKKCEEGKVFDSDTLSCTLYSANITCPEGQIFNNHTSSCEDKKVDTSKENDDGTTQDGDDTTKDGDGPRQDGDGTTQNDDPHELAYDIKSKGAGRTLRKLEDEKQIIVITINGNKDKKVNYLSDYFYKYIKKPDEVFLNNNNENYHNDYSITLNQDGENKIEVMWNNKLTSLESLFAEWKSIVSLDLSNFDTSNVEDMDNMFKGCSSLLSLELSNFDTSNLEDMDDEDIDDNIIFNECSQL